jgi:hypothetical protein
MEGIEEAMTTPFTPPPDRPWRGAMISPTGPGAAGRE